MHVILNGRFILICCIRIHSVFRYNWIKIIWRFNYYSEKILVISNTIDTHTTNTINGRELSRSHREHSSCRSHSRSKNDHHHHHSNINQRPSMQRLKSREHNRHSSRSHSRRDVHDRLHEHEERASHSMSRSHSHREHSHSHHHHGSHRQ